MAYFVLGRMGPVVVVVVVHRVILSDALISGAAAGKCWVRYAYLLHTAGG